MSISFKELLELRTALRW